MKYKFISVRSFPEAYASKLKGLVFFIFLSVNICFSQAEYSENTQTWSQYLLVLKLNSHWNLNSDIGYRTQNDFVKNRFQTFSRIGLNYISKNNFQFGGGYFYFNTAINTNSNRSEHRLFQQFVTDQKIGSLKLIHRYRLEERFLQKIGDNGVKPDFDFNFRGRYQATLSIPILKSNPQSFYLQLQEEILVNFGPNVNGRNFDQNRVFAGLGTSLFKNLQTVIGYQYIFSQLSLNRFEHAHVIRLVVIHNLELARKEKLKDS